MNDSKANEAAAEPPLDCRVGHDGKEKNGTQLYEHGAESELGENLLRPTMRLP